MISQNSTFLKLGLLALLTFLAALYAFPNIYPDKPILQITSDEKIDHSLISSTLEKENINPRWYSTDTLNFEDIEEQMKARDILQASLPQHYQLALNLQTQVPSWLSSIGAKPMKLGLDLQGGVHFLLEVDTRALTSSQETQNIEYLGKTLKEQKIRYTEIKEDSGYITIELLNPAHQQVAYRKIQTALPQFSTTTTTTGLKLLAPKESKATLVNYAVEQTINSLEKRINELGISEATIQRQGDYHISIDLPGIQDIAHAKKIIGKTATLQFQMVDPDQNSTNQDYPTKFGPEIKLLDAIILSGDSIAFAHAKMNDGSPVVDIRLDGNAHQFYKTTASSVGKRMAVVYAENKASEDGDSVLEKIVISAPVIQQPLHDSFYINGMSSFAEAKDLALLLRSGALAAPVEFVEETTIGPTLGQDNIFKGVLSLVVGSSLVFLFMGYYYRALGMIANIALLLNILLTISVLSLLNATLTLPGIAGIILSVGMAVDANVLINERIREESLAGYSLLTSIRSGYDKALTAIIDANMTTLIVTLILFSLGAGAVKGFAVTTCIGILASIITSVFFTRSLTEIAIKLGVIKTVSMSHDWFENIPTINFMGLRKSAYIFSGIVFAACLLIIPLKGINLGLDFTGGQQYILETNGDESPESIRQALQSSGIDKAQVQAYGSSHTFLIKISDKDSLSPNETKQRLLSSLPSSQIIQSAFIGPQVGSSMLTNSLIAVAAALAATMIYVAIRFEYRFAISAILSLIHDPILIFGIFSLLQMEFNLIALAAALTILGYSINDTIVVYDRVRETFQRDAHSTPESVINQAINQTLSRTILTSCLTLTVVLSLFFFGGDYLRGFSLSLAIGIIIGTYSSIYIAGSSAVQLGLKRSDLIKPKVTGELV